MPAPRLAPNSLLTVADQEEAYRQAMGEEAAARQTRAKALAEGRCVCTSRTVRRKWGGAAKATPRVVHDAECPRFEPWMRDD